MKMLKSSYLSLAVIAGLAAVGVAGVVEAAPPPWVTSSISDANVVFTEYLAAAAPEIMKAVAGIAGLGLVIAFVRRAIRG